MKKSLLFIGVAGVVFFLLGFFVGKSRGLEFPTGAFNGGSPELRLGGKYTNPLLECEVAEGSIASQKEDFTPDLTSYINELKNTTNIADVGVYFRDLNNGPVIGVNQTEAYAPASLLKVPVLISYLRWAEDKPAVLEEKIVYDQYIDAGYQQQFAPLVPLELGKTYTAKELIENMIRYSDNQALLLLVERLPKEYQEELFTLVGIDSNLITDPIATLSVRRYSIFFRVLFNASFLSRTHSEYALKLLTETTFTNGLRAGVPEYVEVAHKFGERKVGEDLQQFHDCGIVYYPNHPYMLCIMTRGMNADTLIASIEDISRFVYQKIHEQYGG